MKKLPDFTKNIGLNNLRNIIGANLIDYKANIVWNPLAIKLLEEGEIDGLDFSDISISEDGTFEYAGLKIVVYIRDQNPRYYDFKTGKSSYKFHFFNCETILNYKREGKYDGKYVVNRSKKFNVNLIDFGKIIKENLELDLTVCKNCLKGFNYKNFANKSFSEKEEIFKNFTREEYFKYFNPEVLETKHNSLSKNLDEYPENWKEISRKAKERVGFKCQDCGKNIEELKKENIALHTHHKDHNKGNNSFSNLEVLCEICHAKHHEHMQN